MSVESRWRSHAFGLSLDSAFTIAGCPDTGPADRLPKVMIDRDKGRSRSAGRRFEDPLSGRFRASAGGRRITCAPTTVPPWRWQRYLIGQVLPFACVLRRLEPWHASAVTVDGRAVMLSGASGAGKSTLAAELILSGAELLADDVVALQAQDGAVLAHPAPGLMSLRPGAIGRLGRERLAGLGTTVGEDAHELRLAVPRHEQPVPVCALYLLHPVAPRAGGPRLEPLPVPDPRLLLGSTFNFVVRDPERLIRQLDVCATLARAARVCRVSIPTDTDPHAVAEVLWADAGGTRERTGG